MKVAKRIAVFAAGLGVCLAMYLPADTLAKQPDNYPNRPINIVIPYPAGGSGDTTVRYIANALSAAWKVPVVVENKPGGSGIIGTQVVERAQADGYSALFTTTLHIQNEAIGRKQPFDPLKDFIPVAQVLRSPAALVVPASSPASNLEEFKTLAKSKKQLDFGSAGNATTSHLYGELLSQELGLNAVHIPYKGGAPMMSGLLGGQLDYAIIDVGSVKPMVDAGRVKILAVTGSERASLLPTIPTFSELGYRNFDSYGWMGIFLRSATDESIVEKWIQSVDAITKSDGYSNAINALGMEPTSISGDDFKDLLGRDIENWKRIASSAQISAE